MALITGLIPAWTSSKQSRANQLASGANYQRIQQEIQRRLIIANTPYSTSEQARELAAGWYGPGLDPQSNQILQRIIAQNTGPAPGQADATKLVTDILQGKYLYGGPNQDPALTRAINAAANVYSDNAAQARARFQTSAEGATGGTAGNAAYLPQAARFEDLTSANTSAGLASMILGYNQGQQNRQQGAIGDVAALNALTEARSQAAFSASDLPRQIQQSLTNIALGQFANWQNLSTTAGQSSPNVPASIAPDLSGLGAGVGQLANAALNAFNSPAGASSIVPGGDAATQAAIDSAVANPSGGLVPSALTPTAVSPNAFGAAFDPSASLWSTAGEGAIAGEAGGAGAAAGAGGLDQLTGALGGWGAAAGAGALGAGAAAGAGLGSSDLALLALA